MHLVQAMDAVPEMRGVLCLFEGVCTGAADGYARIAGKPAITVLHLGPGLWVTVLRIYITPGVPRRRLSILLATMQRIMCPTMPVNIRHRNAGEKRVDLD